MDTFSLIKEHSIILIMRNLPKSKLLRAANALIRGGIRLVEVTFDQLGEMDDTAESIRTLIDEFGDALCIGAGTVMNIAQLKAAKQAGAKYIISPNTDPDVVCATKAAGLLSMPGALTPSEIVNAHALGADVVKIFPAGQMGLGYFSALRAPLAHIPLAAVGGVTPDNICAFRKAGAVAFGISTGILKQSLVDSGAYDDITAAALAYAAALMGKS
ncbi:MAG: bifunctional 4-hydroxy-2-oxoglutarate aldolase/2-dehydro-3-deoxy-phosphogluconate aldolase [Clostridia bacterium]